MAPTLEAPTGPPTDPYLICMFDKDSCKGCKYHDDFTAACGNVKSPYVADFWHSGCEYKEEDAVKDDSNDPGNE